MDGSIRKFQATDADAVLQVWLDASRVGHPFFDAAELARQYGIVREDYLPHAEMWVYEHAGDVAGFIGMLGTTIGGLFVAPAWHRRGIGRALVRHVNSLKGPLAVEVFSRNQSAQIFYASCGFRKTGVSRNEDVAPPQELFVMEQPGHGRLPE